LKIEEGGRVDGGFRYDDLQCRSPRSTTELLFHYVQAALEAVTRNRAYSVVLTSTFDADGFFFKELLRTTII
jgi:hypothetical protein